MSAVIERAKPSDRWEILDFANLVFSQAAVPHDFKALLPKMYADGVPFENDHYVAREDGKIMGLVSALPFEMRSGGRTLKVAYVGTVSVHLYRRGSGYMKACMKLMHEDMEGRGAQIFVLGGLRQRYGYYGYSSGLPGIRHTVTPTNAQKALGDLDASSIRFEELAEAPEEALRLHGAQPVYCTRERYLDWMHSWKRKYYRVAEGDKTLGFATEGLNDIELCDENDLLRVVKAWIEKSGRVEIQLGLAEVARNRALSAVAEHTSLVNTEMVRVVDWPGTADFLLSLRGREIAPLEDGACRLGIEGAGTLEMAVKNGEPACRMTDSTPDKTLSALDAQSLLFSTRSLYLPEGIRNWLPLPLFVPPADCY